MFTFPTPTDNHIQGVFHEVLDSNALNEPISLSFPHKKDLLYLREREKFTLQNSVMAHVAYSFSCYNEILNQLSNEIIINRFSNHLIYIYGN